MCQAVVLQRDLRTCLHFGWPLLSSRRKSWSGISAELDDRLSNRSRQDERRLIPVHFGAGLPTARTFGFRKKSHHDFGFQHKPSHLLFIRSTDSLPVGRIHQEKERLQLQNSSSTLRCQHKTKALLWATRLCLHGTRHSWLRSGGNSVESVLSSCTNAQRLWNR